MEHIGLRIKQLRKKKDLTTKVVRVLSQSKRKSALFRVRFMLALPIFPGRHQPSIVGAYELNFCVRDGNRWTLIAINTNSCGWGLTHLLYQRSRWLPTEKILPQDYLFVNTYFQEA